MEFLTSPWEWWVSPFTENPFMARALLAGVLVALCTSVVGVWVVLRGMAFLGDALAHGVLPGIAIAFILGVSTTAGAVVAAVAMVVGISLIRNHSPLPDDTSIGVLFVGMLALAVVVMSSGQAGSAGDLNRFLFGSIAGVGVDDLRGLAVAALITLVGVLVFHRALLVMTFDEKLATLLGLRPRLTHLALLALVTVAIVASFRTVGSLLVFAFLIAPPASSALLVRRVPAIMATAVLLGSFSALVGVLVSFHHDTATGATMALVSVVIFFCVLTATGLRRASARRRYRTVAKTSGSSA